MMRSNLTTFCSRDSFFRYCIYLIFAVLKAMKIFLFSCRSFIVLGLMFNSVIYLSYLFYCGENYESKYIFIWISNCLSTIYWNGNMVLHLFFFPPLNYLCIFVASLWTMYVLVLLDYYWTFHSVLLFICPCCCQNHTISIITFL